jgi:membrane protein YqaA with SNARE-associated domain
VTESIITALGIYVGALAVGAISSVVPLISVEVFLVAVTLAQGPSGAPALIALATAGQVLGKLPIYWSARGLASMPGRHLKWIARMRRWSDRLGDRPYAIVGISALTGIPPFSIISTTAGALALSVRWFCIVIAVGRAVRFTSLVALAA